MKEKISYHIVQKQSYPKGLNFNPRIGKWDIEDIYSGLGLP